MNPIEEFQQEIKDNVQRMSQDIDIKNITGEWINKTAKYKYTYNFSWMGRPIIQLPQDIIAMQEIIWSIKPDLIIETGIAHGGSIIFYASMLELLNEDGQVLGIDIDIRKHNKAEIEKHPMSKRITMIEGSSTDEDTVTKVYEFARDKKKIMVLLDSMHTHEHVLKELQLYSPLVMKDSYLVVFDTIIEDMPDELFSNRPWEKGNNPKTAVWQFLKENKRFVIDKEIENRILFTVSPDGFLKCIK